MTSFQSTPLSLSINWSNKTGFDNVKRLKIEHIFNNITEDRILDRAQYGPFFQNNAQNLSFSHIIERKLSNVGKHTFKMYYSYLTEGYGWIDLLNGKLTTEITPEHIGTDFNAITGQKLLLKPNFEDTRGFMTVITGEIIKYTIVNKGLDIFGSSVEFVMDNNTFYMRREGKYMKVGSNGAIEYTQIFEDAHKFYRIIIRKPNDIVIQGIATSDDPDKALFLFRHTSESEPIFKSLFYILDHSKIHMEVYETSLRDQGKTPTDDDYLNKTLVVLPTFTTSVSSVRLIKCDIKRPFPGRESQCGEFNFFDYTLEIIPIDDRSFYIKNESDNKYMTVDGVGLIDFIEIPEAATPLYRCELKLENNQTFKVISTIPDIYNAFLLTMRHIDQPPISCGQWSCRIPPPKIEIGFRRIHVIDSYDDANILIRDSAKCPVEVHYERRVHCS